MPVKEKRIETSPNANNLNTLIHEYIKKIYQQAANLATYKLDWFNDTMYKAIPEQLDGIYVIFTSEEI